MPAPGGKNAYQAGPRPQVQNDVAGPEGKVPSEENTAEFGSQIFGGHADQAIFVQEEMHASAIRHGKLPEAWPGKDYGRNLSERRKTVNRATHKDEETGLTTVQGGQ
jgi:hypothetical protein